MAYTSGGDQGYGGYYQAPARQSVVPAPPAVPVGLSEAAATEVRNRVVDRLRAMNALHALHAWERMHTNPIGPHGLAFLYWERTPQGSYAIRAGTRLFLDGDDVATLPALLSQMVDIARDYLSKGAFTPLSCMVNRSDEMGPDAVFTGIGVSSLDGPAGPWRQVRQQAGGPMDVPGRCLALLGDGTELIIDRSPHHLGDESMRLSGGVRILSSQQMDGSAIGSLRPWGWLTDQSRGPEVAEVLAWLRELYMVVAAGENARPPGQHH